MSTEIDEFEQSMREEINAFLNSQQSRGKPPRSTEKPARKLAQRASAREVKTGHIVRLAVRTKQLEIDTAFEYHSTSISKLEAQMEAEKAARKAGYPIIGYVIDIQRL